MFTHRIRPLRTTSLHRSCRNTCSESMTREPLDLPPGLPALIPVRSVHSILLHHTPQLQQAFCLTLQIASLVFCQPNTPENPADRRTAWQRSRVRRLQGFNASGRNRARLQEQRICQRTHATPPPKSGEHGTQDEAQSSSSAFRIQRGICRRLWSISADGCPDTNCRSSDENLRKSPHGLTHSPADQRSKSVDRVSSRLSPYRAGSNSGPVHQAHKPGYEPFAPVGHSDWGRALEPPTGLSRRS